MKRLLSALAVVAVLGISAPPAEAGFLRAAGKGVVKVAKVVGKVFVKVGKAIV